MINQKIIILEANKNRSDFLKARVEQSINTDYIICVSSVEEITSSDNLESTVLFWSKCKFERDFFQEIKSFKMRFPKLKIIFLSDVLDPESICKIIDIGVSGFISNNEPQDIFDNMLKSLNFNVYPYSKSVIQILVSTLLPTVESRRQAKLTKRENDVLICLVRGLSNKAIAKTLGISPYTIADHNKSIFNKYNVRSRTELVSLQLNH